MWFLWILTAKLRSRKFCNFVSPNPPNFYPVNHKMLRVSTTLTQETSNTIGERTENKRTHDIYSIYFLVASSSRFKPVYFFMLVLKLSMDEDML